MAVRVVSHKDEASATLEHNILRALKAMGEDAVGYVVEKMETGYHDVHISKRRGAHTDIVETTTLEGSIDSEVDVGKKLVYVGTPIKYATYVHEGTSKLKGRAFIKDAVQENADTIYANGAEYLKEGFD